MSETKLVRATVPFVGGPRVGHVAELPVKVADSAIRCGFAVEVSSLKDRLPKGEFR